MKIELARYVDGDYMAFEMTFCKLEIVFRTIEFWDILDFDLKIGSDMATHTDKRKRGFDFWLPTLSIALIY